MHLTTAIQLIEKGINGTFPQQWMDLGAGSGPFTQALSSLLPPGSNIIAVDIDLAPMTRIKGIQPGVEIKMTEADFEQMEYEADSCNGILMANSFHFVADKLSLIYKFRKALAQDGRVVFVEYDLDKANPWVPFPVGFASLNAFLQAAALPEAVKLREIPSVYQRANIYSALVHFRKK